MFKNQLQELAQRSCFNLPAYACLREGPDHAPRFKATVSFNGEVFQSPGFFSTLRQAEHAAAEQALSTLSRRGPAMSLAARVLDETGVCKNLLQETAQRAGVALPAYNTVRSGPGHLPVFTCTVEVAGMRFAGEPAKTKKQAEKNAAMAAWSSLKKFVNKGQATPLADIEVCDEQEQNTIARALATVGSRGERLSNSTGNIVQPSLLQQQQRITPYRNSMEERIIQRGGGPPSGPPPTYIPHHVNPTWVPMERRSQDSLTGYSHEMLQNGRFPQQQQVSGQNLMQSQNGTRTPGASGSVVVRHTSIAIKPGMAYQPRPRMLIEETAPEVDYRPPMAYQARARQLPAAGVIGSGMALSSSSMRSVPSSPARQQQTLDEHQADEEEWLRETTGKKETVGLSQPVRQESNNDMSGDMMWPRSYWPHSLGSSMSSMTGMGMDLSHIGVSGMDGRLAPPVTVRTLIQVHAAPRRSRDEEDEDASDSIEGEAATRQVLSQLSL